MPEIEFVTDYLPAQVNTGAWVTAHTLESLRERVSNARIVLPVCSLGTPAAELARLGELVLPPLYHEALDSDLLAALTRQIRHCFPYHPLTRSAAQSATEVEVVELDRRTPPTLPRPRVLAYSVDTAVEQHGPHLPLATDTIQSYLVLRRLAAEMDRVWIGPPVEYGHLTWGLPFGMSIDVTPPLLTRYVAAFAAAVQRWLQPELQYVVDVHGSIVHRQAIVAGLQQSGVRHAFRWLYDPLVEFAGDRGDQHAGGVETALVELASLQLVDRGWWPARIETLAAGQMDLATAVELTPDLPRFVERVEAGTWNGIVGDIANYYKVNADVMLERMVRVARGDVNEHLATNEA